MSKPSFQPNQVIALCIRLFAVAFLIYGLRSAANFYLYHHQSGEQLPWLVLMVSMVFLIFAAAILWLFPMTIAGWLMLRSASRDADCDWSGDDVWSTAFVFVGLLWLYWAASDAIYWFIFLFLATPDLGWGSFGPDTKAAVITTVAELMLAMSLILGAKSWKRFLFRLRYGREPLQKRGANKSRER